MQGKKILYKFHIRVFSLIKVDIISLLIKMYVYVKDGRYFQNIETLFNMIEVSWGEKIFPKFYLIIQAQLTLLKYG